MTGSCLKCLPLPIILKTHDMYYKALDYKDLSDLVPAYVTNFITCHSLSLSAPVHNSSISRYALPCLGAFALAVLSAWNSFYPTPLHIFSLQSQLKCHLLRVHLFPLHL